MKTIRRSVRRKTPLSEETRRELERWVIQERASLAQRAKIALLDSEGWSTQWIADELGIARLTVYKWRRRFATGGFEALRDLPRPGQPRKLSVVAKDALVRSTRQTLPAGSIAWSIRRLARTAQVTEHQVRGVWRSAGVPPARIASAIDEARRWLGRSARPLGIHLWPGRSLLLFEAKAAVDPAARPQRTQASFAVLRRKRDRQDTLYAACDVVGSADAAVVLDAADVLSLLDHAVVRADRESLVHAVFSSDRDAWAEAVVAATAAIPRVRLATFPTLDAWVAAAESMLAESESQPDLSDARRATRDLRRSIEAFVSRACDARTDDLRSGMFTWSSVAFDPSSRQSGFFSAGREPVRAVEA